MRLGQRLLIVAPGLALLAWAGWVASQMGRVDQALIDVGKTVAAWDRRTAPSHDSWGAVMERLSDAERTVPGNPVTHELLGLAYAHRVDVPSLSGRSEEQFTRSLVLRPVAANTWANLLEAKYLGGDTGASFETVLRTASSLGPSDPQVQRMVANFGLAVWDEVSGPTRSAIDGSLAAGVRRNPLETLRIAQRRGRLNAACRHLAGLSRQPVPTWSEICQSTEATR